MALPFPKKTIPKQEDAEHLAIAALSFLASNESRLATFIAATGYDLEGIKAQAGSPDFLAGILDFLLSDESLLLVFASHMQIDPAEIGVARRALVGEAGHED